MHAPRAPQQSDNLFEFNGMRNRVGRKNLLEALLTAFILNNITASMLRDAGISLRFFPERAPRSQIPTPILSCPHGLANLIAGEACLGLR